MKTCSLSLVIVPVISLLSLSSKFPYHSVPCDHRGSFKHFSFKVSTMLIFLSRGRWRSITGRKGSSQFQGIDCEVAGQCGRGRHPEEIYCGLGSLPYLSITFLGPGSQLPQNLLLAQATWFPQQAPLWPCWDSEGWSHLADAPSSGPMNVRPRTWGIPTPSGHLRASCWWSNPWLHSGGLLCAGPVF